MRCKCCDINLFDHKRINKATGKEEDLCSYCLNIALDPDHIITKVYVLEGIYEGVTRIPREYYDNE